MKKAIIYIHGKGGSYLEAEQYKRNCVGFDIVGIDYDEYLPWVVQKQIKAIYANLAQEYEHISIIANSIGAYFAMHTLQGCAIEKALFISPILDMERLILDMMQWANVTEQELCEKGKIPTDFGEPLSWECLCFVRQNPIRWNIPTEILYAEKDNLTSRATVDLFISRHKAYLTVLEDGEHWFHTDEQINFLNKWMKKAVDMQKIEITLRPFEDTDLVMFTEWLNKDYILKWYKDPDDWLTEVNGRNDEYSWIHHLIVMCNETPIGFCQYYDCYDAKSLEDWYTVTRRGSIYSIDYLIGDESYLGKGYGKKIIRILTEHIKATGNVCEIIVQPDENNNASNGVLLANGYIFDEEKKYYRKLL